jgi:hypothetical protein
MFLAKPKIKDRSGNNTFVAFDKYLLDVIAKCESVVGSVMLDCLNGAGIFEATIDPEVAAAEYREGIEQSHAMPDNVKAMALAVNYEPEWAVAAHSSAMTRLREVLAPCNSVKPSVY